MMIELKPEQQEVLDHAAKSGMSPDEVLDQAFAVIHEQHKNGDWMLAEREAVAAHVAEGFAQAERGELVDAEEAVRILRERRAKRQLA
jgi:predicted transcriptional regulator